LAFFAENKNYNIKSNLRKYCNKEEALTPKLNVAINSGYDSKNTKIKAGINMEVETGQ
jgi:hypothetical protein